MLPELPDAQMLPEALLNDEYLILLWFQDAPRISKNVSEAARQKLPKVPICSHMHTKAPKHSQKL